MVGPKAYISLFGLGLALFTWVFERARPLLLIEFFCLCNGLMWGDFLNVNMSDSIFGLVWWSVPISLSLGYIAFRLEKSSLSAEAREYVWGILAACMLIVAFESEFQLGSPHGIFSVLVDASAWGGFFTIGWFLFSTGGRLAMVPWSVLAGLVLLGGYSTNPKDHLAVGIGLWIGLSLVQMALVHYLNKRGTHGKPGPNEPNANDGSAG